LRLMVAVRWVSALATEEPPLSAKIYQRKLYTNINSLPDCCSWLTETSQLLRLTETEQWALLDEIQQWRTSGYGQLSSTAEVFLASRHYSAKCEEIFDLWRMHVRARVC
jgi:hypothetical protein